MHTGNVVESLVFAIARDESFVIIISERIILVPLCSMGGQKHLMLRHGFVIVIIVTLS